jgi:uncharacterized membrane protein
MSRAVQRAIGADPPSPVAWLLASCVLVLVRDLRKVAAQRAPVALQQLCKHVIVACINWNVQGTIRPGAVALAVPPVCGIVSVGVRADN